MRTTGGKLPGTAVAVQQDSSPAAENHTCTNTSETKTYGPVPLWFVKSPPWHMKFGITRWKVEPERSAEDKGDGEGGGA